MQASLPVTAPMYMVSNQPFLRNTAPNLVDPPSTAIANTVLAPPIPAELLPQPDAETRGQLATVQLSVDQGSPTQSAWCSVSNLIAVALAPEPGSSTAQILVLEPSNPDEGTALELPMAGPGDYISHLEWSWPGQRRALLSATASGRVVVWTQPSQQGQDDSIYPRCIDDWHGQLLLEVDPASAAAGAGGPTGNQPHDPQHPHPIKQEQGPRGSPYIKPEPGTDGAAAALAGAGSPPLNVRSPPPGGRNSHTNLHPNSQPQAQAQQQPQQPALAALCWLRQPAGGRVWSTSTLAMKRLDPLGEARPAGPGGGQAGSQPENFESVFCEDGPLVGAVPHWARPHQLTAAVLSATGSLTVLWCLASKLPNTLSWHRSKSIRIPPPPEAAATAATAGADGSGDSEAAAAAAAAEWRIASASMCAVFDGSLAIAVVYGKRRDAVYLYSMRGNPTLSGQLVSSQPGASAAAATTVREAPPPTVTLMGALAIPPGLLARQCRIQAAGGGAARRAFILAQSAGGGSHQPSSNHLDAWPAAPAAAAVPAVVLSFAETSADSGTGGGGGWCVERMSAQLEPYGSPAAAAAAAAAGVASLAAAGMGPLGMASPEGPSLSLAAAVDGSKLVVAHGSVVYSLDAETLAVLAAQDMAQMTAMAEPYGDDSAADGDSASAPPPRAVVALTSCLSANSCCVCSVVRLASLPRRRRTAPLAAGGDDGGGAAAAAAAAALEDASEGLLLDGLDADDGPGGGSGDAVVLSIRTIPDVVPPPSPGPNGAAALEGMEDAIACNLDTLRLAWGVLHRTSLWDVAERLRSTWLAGRREHVTRSLDQLDGLLYGHDDAALRTALAPGISRAKLEVLRRLPHQQAALLAADLLAAARIVQYCQSLYTLANQQAEALANEETRTVAAHMVWFVLEVHTLMLAGLKLWAESAEAQAPGGAQPDGGGAGGTDLDLDPTAPCSGGGSLGMLPLIRLCPDYTLYKHALMSLFAPAGSTKAGGDGRGTPAGFGWNPQIQEMLGGHEATTRLRMLANAFRILSNNAQKALITHMQALHQQQQEGLAPGAPVMPVTTADVDQVNSTKGEMPRVLMHRTFQTSFPGIFHLHYARSKGIMTSQLLAQWFRQDELARLSPYISLSREAILDRYRALGLQQQLVDRRRAPHLAARRLWMSFRAPAPPPELHAHVLTQHVSVRQRQRWRRQRAAALALSSAAPLWSHVQGTLVDDVTGVPLPPGTPWSLEGASAVGAVTAQMGPGVGAAAARRNLPPLLATVQRAWVGCAPPAELGSLWKRARLGLEQDMEY